MDVASGGAAFPELCFGCCRTFSLIDPHGVTVKEEGLVSWLDTIFAAEVRRGFASKGVSRLTLAVVILDLWLFSRSPVWHCPVGPTSV